MTDSLAGRCGGFGAIFFIVGWLIFLAVGFSNGSYFIAGIGLLFATIGELSLALAFLFFLIGK